jgi:hypothetical protein
MRAGVLSHGEVEARLARVRAGERVRVSEHLRLYPDTAEDRSEVGLGPHGTLEHVTYFHEFAPGHGWSTELREVRAIDEGEARRLLALG